MPTFQINTEIKEPIDTCFDLARDIGFHLRSLEHTNERVVAGRRDGLIELGESVTWEARHLGMNRRMTVAITAMDRPTHFRDEQTDGPFKRFVHDHEFEDLGNGTTQMTDRIEFASPFGFIGRTVDRLFMAGYLKRLIQQRGLAIKVEAERVIRGSKR